MWLHHNLRIPGSRGSLVDDHLGSGYSSSPSLLKNRKDTEVQDKKKGFFLESEASNLPSEVDVVVPWQPRPVSSATHFRRKEIGCRFTSMHAWRPISIVLSTSCKLIMSGRIETTPLSLFATRDSTLKVEFGLA